MSMTTLLDGIVTELRAVESCIVEKYCRTKPPTALTIFVQPLDEAEEQTTGMGNNFGTGWHFILFVEVPWDDKSATGDALQAAIEIVRTWVAANRQYASGYVATVGRATYGYVQYPNAVNECFAAQVPLNFELPRRG